MKDKVFGIGFHKTATASLGSALELLGYNLGGKFPIDGPISHDALALRAIESAKDYELFKDNPWPPLFKDLDRAFPGSKFILTIRDPDEWLRSVVRHFGRNSTRCVSLFMALVVLKAMSKSTWKDMKLITVEFWNISRAGEEICQS